MTAQEILDRYEEGRETPTGVVLDVLSLSSKRSVAEALELLPVDILKELRTFVGYYSERTGVFRGPRPKMATVRFIKDWFAKGQSPRLRSRATTELETIRTVPIDNDPDFRGLQSHADLLLAARGYRLLEKKGSSSWIDPTDDTVRFKLSNSRTGVFFGAREEWANVLGIPLAQLGNLSKSFSPSPILFRGDYVTNTPIGREPIDKIAKPFPLAGHVPSNMDQKAANYGDRMKHALLLEVLSRTDEWFKVTYAETHAGAGVYCQAGQTQAHWILDLFRLVEKTSPRSDNGAGDAYLRWLKDWWKDPANRGTYPGSAVTAQRWLQSHSRPFDIRVTENEPQTFERLRVWLNGQAEQKPFQEELDWLTEADDLMLLVDPFACIQSFEKGERKRRMNMGWIDHKVVRNVLQRCAKKTRAVVSLWWGYGRSPIAAKSNEPTCELLRSWAHRHEAACVIFEDKHNHTNAVVGIGKGTEVVRRLPKGWQWRASWLADTVFERK
jgi:hypothetical protein